MQNVFSIIYFFSNILNCINTFYRDKSIPSLDSLVFDDEEHSILSDLIEKQKEMENSCTEPPPKAEEMLPPNPCTDFNTARLFLSHFGFLSRLDDTNVNIYHLNLGKKLKLMEKTPSINLAGKRSNKNAYRKITQI